MRRSPPALFRPGPAGRVAAQRGEAGPRQGPVGRLGGNAPARPQHRVGADQGVGGRADVHAGVVQHEVFEVHQFALEPQGGAAFGKMRPRNPALAHRARPQPFVEAGERILRLGERRGQRAPRHRVGQFVDRGAQASWQTESGFARIFERWAAKRGLAEI